MRILGVDYGEKRIGLAVSIPFENMAVPLKVIEVISKKKAIQDIAQTVMDESVDMIVVGLPVNMNGSSGEMVDRVMDFVAKVAEATGKKVETWDERLTTVMAEKSMLDGDLSRSKRKKIRDKISAQILLQDYIESKYGQR
jgi:putative holliday junction resolvase